MKRSVLTIIAICLTLAAFSQESLFKKGNTVVNASIGFGSVLYSGSGYTSSVPPLAVSAEWGIKDGIADKGVIGVGGYLGFSSHKWEYMGWGWKYSNTIIGARGTFHYPLLEKLDTYTGLMLGYDIVTSKEFGTTIDGYNYNSSSSGGIWAWYAGARYYFSDKFAGMAEIGYGISWLNLGIAYKIK
jgi:hypothetical protein